MPKLKTDKPRNLTGNRGASVTRAEIKKAIQVMPCLTIGPPGNGRWILESAILDFIDGMAPRANAKPGGLGRKWTAKKKGSKPNRTGQK